MKTIYATGLLTVIDLKPDQKFSHHLIQLMKDDVPFGDPVNTTESNLMFDVEPGTYSVTGVSVDEAGENMTPVFSSLPIVVGVDTPDQATVLTGIRLSLAPPSN